MSRIQLRPALRAYAHAPAAAPSAFTNVESMDFDGSTDYIASTSGTGISTDDYSISFWCKIAAGTADGEVGAVMGSGRHGATGNYWKSRRCLVKVYRENSYWGNAIYFSDTSGNIDEYSSAAVSMEGNTTAVWVDDTWCHITCTRGSDTRVYVNGVLDASYGIGSSCTVASSVHPQCWRVGRNPSNETVIYGNGLMDEVCTWGEELSAAEALELYNSGSALDMTTFTGTAPVHWWRFDGDTDGASASVADHGSASATLTGAGGEGGGSPDLSSDVP